VLLLVLGLFAITWENKLRAQFGGAWVYKDLVLLNATFFYIYSLERYVLAVVVIFCSHCLTPLEIELVENVEVFGGNLQSCAKSLFHFGVVGGLTCLYGTLGAMAEGLNRPHMGRLFATVVLAILTQTWAVVG
jgi:hypothetical protein